MPEKPQGGGPLPQQTGTQQKGQPTPGKSTPPSGAPSGKDSNQKKK